MQSPGMRRADTSVLDVTALQLIKTVRMIRLDESTCGNLILQNLFVPRLFQHHGCI